MIFGNTAGKPGLLTDTQEITRNPGSLMARRIWLPKALYAALPYFYLLAGLAALLATLYISNWYWILPHYLLFAGACLHMSILVYRRRHRRKT
jgi:Flp pilus assembly protein TadB